MVVPDRPIHLDSVLAFCAVKAAQNAGAIGYAAQERLPLSRISSDKDWVWQASVLHITYAADPVFTSRTRPFEYFNWVNDMGRQWRKTARETIDNASGPAKAFLLRQSIGWVSECHAWCVGERDTLVELLAQLDGLGAGVNTGWGRIRSVTVETAPEAAWLWARRALPLSLPQFCTPDHLPGTSVLHPPYWERQREVDVFDYIP